MDKYIGELGFSYSSIDGVMKEPVLYEIPKGERLAGCFITIGYLTTDFKNYD